nr:hypothetical protein [Pyrinomonadaceae bacterium]
MFKKSFSVLFLIFSAIVFANAQGIKYSPDGKNLAVNFPVSFSNDKNIQHIIFFDSLSGKLKSSVNMTDLQRGKLLFTNSGQSLLIANQTDTKNIKLTADNKTEAQDFSSSTSDYDNELVSLAFSADGKIFYKLYSNKLVAYNFFSQTVKEDNNKVVAEITAENSNNAFLALSSNGKIAVEYRKKGAEHSLVIHDLAAKTEKIIKLPYNFVENGDASFSAEISENGEKLVLNAQTEEYSQLTVWNLKTATQIGTFAFTEAEGDEAADKNPVKNFTISPDGKKIAVKIGEKYDDNNDTVVLWDTETKKDTIAEVKRFSEEFFVENFVFSPDSKNLTVFSEVLLPNNFSAKVQILDANTGKFIRE